ncbi:MAG: hypothetical protein GXY87_01210 [Tissierellia bacterium]|nr:hypothetical protein [Tissierellia bacterium]
MKNSIFGIIIIILAVILIWTVIKSLFQFTWALIVIAALIFAIKFFMDKRNTPNV